MSDYSSGELTRNSRVDLKEDYANSDTQIQVDDNNHDTSIGEVDPAQSEHSNLVSLNDADDEFYDVMEPLDCDESGNGWMAECSHQKSQVKLKIAAFIALERNEQYKVILKCSLCLEN